MHKVYWLEFHVSIVYIFLHMLIGSENPLWEELNKLFYIKTLFSTIKYGLTQPESRKLQQVSCRLVAL